MRSPGLCSRLPCASVERLDADDAISSGIISSGFDDHCVGISAFGCHTWNYGSMLTFAALVTVDTGGDGTNDLFLPAHLTNELRLQKGFPKGTYSDINTGAFQMPAANGRLVRLQTDLARYNLFLSAGYDHSCHLVDRHGAAQSEIMTTMASETSSAPWVPIAAPRKSPLTPSQA